MAGDLTAVVQRFFDALDKADVEAGLLTFESDAQSIDEITRKWMRGEGEVTGYVRQLMEMASDIHSEIRDVHEVDWGDTGTVTFTLEQDYTLEGERTHILAPTTCVLRRQGGEWKIALFHSIPLPPES